MSAFTSVFITDQLYLLNIYYSLFSYGYLYIKTTQFLLVLKEWGTEKGEEKSN